MTENHKDADFSDMFHICGESWGPIAVRALLKVNENRVYTDKIQLQAEHRGDQGNKLISHSLIPS